MLEKLADVDRQYVKSKVEAGFYSSEIEAVRDAVRTMREEEERIDYMRSLLAPARASRADAVPYTPNFMAEVMEEAIKARAEGKPISEEVIPDGF